MHADPEKYIAHPSAANRQERSQQEPDRYRRTVLQVPEDIPGPPVKKHRKYIWDQAVAYSVHPDRLYQFQPPGDKHEKAGKKSRPQKDCQEPEHLGPTVKSCEDAGMYEYQKPHHVGRDEEGMENK
jgi:hypothetical protein